VLAATYIRELVDRKEHDPADDLISRLATDYVATGQLNRETAAISGAVMMQAGHETTANMIALGTVALLQHRDVFERLGQTDDQCVIANMVEELVRYLTIVPARWIGWRSKTSPSVVNRSMPATSSPWTFLPGTGILISSITQKSSTSTETPADTWVSATAYISASSKISRKSKCRSPSPRWSGACLSPDWRYRRMH
jgi:hypothetical protein